MIHDSLQLYKDGVPTGTKWIQKVPRSLGNNTDDSLWSRFLFAGQGKEGRGDMGRHLIRA